MEDTSYNKFNLLIYPSPSDGAVFIKNNYNEKLFLQVVSLTGSVIYKSEINSGNEIRISDLPNGMFMIEGYSESFQFSEQKLLPVINVK